MNFYVGYHQPGRAQNVGRPVMISYNRLADRVSDFEVGEWILDSGAFTQISTHGEFQHTITEYARGIERWSRCGDMQIAVSQDYMCEPAILDAQNKSVYEHQCKTIGRYKLLRRELDSTINLMPVLQGWTASDYKRHVEMYDSLLDKNQWVGVGSVCKRNSTPADVEMVLRTINDVRPDLRLHGFGIKATALKRPPIREMLHSADSMAWSFRARKNGGDANCPLEARRFYDSLTQKQSTAPLFD